MSDNDDITFWGIIKFFIWCLAVLFVLAGLVFIFKAVTRPMNAISGLADRTFNASNMERTYELFHDRNAGYVMRLRQVASTQREYDAEKDTQERQRIRIELNAQKASCRDIATAYNADAAKTNRSIFQGRSLPETLDIGACN